MPTNKIIAVVGMCGSGKSVLADALVERGWGYVRFGQLTMDIIKEKGMEVAEVNEKSVRESLRAEHGMGAYAKLNIPKFDKVLEEKNLVADGLYSWDEYKILKNYYGEKLTVAAIYAPPETRYERLEKRQLTAGDNEARNRPLSRDNAKSRDYAEIEKSDKGGPIAMADYTVLNTGSRDEFHAEIKKFIIWHEAQNQKT